MAVDNLLQDPPGTKPHDPEGGATPEERAAYAVWRLEQFIREGRATDQGMSLRQWQEMARAEIADAIVEAETHHQKDFIVTQRMLFIVASALITIGFWGALWAYDKAHYLTVAIICVASGLALLGSIGEWRIRKVIRRREARKRKDALGRIEDLTIKIRRLERELEDEAKELEKKVEESVKKATKRHQDLNPFQSRSQRNGQ